MEEHTDKGKISFETSPDIEALIVQLAEVPYDVVADYTDMLKQARK